MKVLIVTVLLSILCHGQTLRISRVAEAAGDHVEQMTLVDGERKSQLFIFKEAVLTDKDVEFARRSPLSVGEIIVRFTADGAKKLRSVTKKMRSGIDRLAVVIEGRLCSAPTVNGVLGRHFVIGGLADLTNDQLDHLARRMSGREPLAKEPDPRPKIKWIPFTEEEYQQRKAMREKLGIFHLEKVPTQEELDAKLRKGMSRREVEEIFGRPSDNYSTGKAGVSHMDYQLAGEKRPANPKREMRNDGFTVNLEDGKVTWWAFKSSNASTELKIDQPAPGPSTLRIVLPEIDLSAEDSNPLDFFNLIKVPNPKQKVNQTDLGLMLTIVFQFSQNADEEVVKADCDLMHTLAHNFPEVAELRKKSSNGTILLKHLRDAVWPYIDRVKPLPGGVEEKAKR